mgnify:FL=1
MRKAEIARKTNETDIKLSLDLDGGGRSEIRCGCGFLEHMLTLFAKHGHFDLALSCAGDTYVDDHHTVEDIGIVLGEAFNKALGDKKGIERYADTILPMDESLVLTAVDLSGRAHLSYSLDIPTEKVGTFDTELCEEFFAAFVRSAQCTLHIKKISGTNSHHIIECAFKSFARTMSDAVKTNGKFKDEILSTKGVL